MINLEAMKKKLPELVCSNSLTMFQIVEILNRAITAERAVELLSKHYTASCNLCPVRCEKNMFPSDECVALVKSWAMKEARAQG